jgi:copper transport protein
MFADGLEPIELDATLGPDGLWQAGLVHLPPGGKFDVVAAVLMTDFRKALVGGELDLQP